MSPGRLRIKAKSGEIPGAKIGKRWIFLREDLVGQRAVHVPTKEQPWHCTVEEPSGGLISRHQTDGEYATPLGLPTNRRRRSFTTRSKQSFGGGENSKRNRGERGKKPSSAAKKAPLIHACEDGYSTVHIIVNSDFCWLCHIRRLEPKCSHETT